MIDCMFVKRHVIKIMRDRNLRFIYFILYLKIH